MSNKKNKKFNKTNSLNLQKNDSKGDEYRSLNISITELDFFKTLKNISAPDQEKPDFVFVDAAKNRIGIEHFRVDISMGNRKNSGTKILHSTTKNIYKKYHDNVTSQIDNILLDLEETLNYWINDLQKFSYQTFYKNFERIFDEHYSKIEAYKTNSHLSKIGFLIEFLVPAKTYKISSKGEPLHIQELRNFPITTEMWQKLDKALDDKLNFVILDTNQTTKKKDAVILLDKNTPPKTIFKEFAPLLKDGNDKVKLVLNS